MYCQDEPQKFGHLSPGLPSAKLTEALGLRRDELPRYIYKMRELGYPPGWLRHAQINQSGITLYHDRSGSGLILSIPTLILSILGERSSRLRRTGRWGN